MWTDSIKGDLMTEENGIKIHAKFDALINPEDLTPHSLNPNQHQAAQIIRLAKIIKEQGFRRPITVSNLSKKITVGHGRRLAAMHLGMGRVPVVYQDYDTTDLEYCDLVADNAVNDWSEFDFSMINAQLQDLGPMDLDLLGFENFELEPADLPDKKKEEKQTKEVTCPHCNNSFNP